MNHRSSSNVLTKKKKIPLVPGISQSSPWLGYHIISAPQAVEIWVKPIHHHHFVCVCVCLSAWLPAFLCARLCSAFNKDFIIFFCSLVLCRTCHCNRLENVFEMLVSHWGSLKRVRRVRLPLVSARLPLDGFPWDLCLGTSMKICWEDTNFVVSGTLLEDLSTSYRCRSR